jgi:hypothetical protein
MDMGNPIQPRTEDAANEKTGRSAALQLVLTLWYPSVEIQ